MDLPEIRRYLARFLNTSQLGAAVAVCKSWHSTFIPFLYSEIRWSNRDKRPEQEALVSYGEHVRTLRLVPETGDFPLETCTSLDRLVIMCHNRTPNWSWLAHLIRQNPQLRRLEAHFLSSRPRYELMAAVSSCPRLRYLWLTCPTLSKQCARLLFDTCVRLERLSIFAHDVDLIPLDRWLEFPQLRRLEIHINSGFPFLYQLELIKRCPRLRSIDWICYEGLFPTAAFCQLFTKSCPLLQKIGLEHWSLLDHDIAKVLDSCPRMLRFAGSDLGFDHRAFQALVRHFAYLTIVDVNQCPGLTSAMCQTILVSCTELRIFSADTLHARDILGLTVEGDKINEGELVHEPQAWVCTKLQQLTLYICGLEGKPADWQRLILRQLAKLTRLTFLSIVPEDGNWNGTEDSRDGLDLRIEAGLGILSSLKLLDSIEFTGLWQQMEEQDLRWMLDAWPRLRDVGGKVHHSEERRLELEKIFEERPVVVKTKMDDSEDFYYNFYFNAHESSDEDEEDCY